MAKEETIGDLVFTYFEAIYGMVEINAVMQEIVAKFEELGVDPSYLDQIKMSGAAGMAGYTPMIGIVTEIGIKYVPEIAAKAEEARAVVARMQDLAGRIEQENENYMESSSGCSDVPVIPTLPVEPDNKDIPVEAEAKKTMLDNLLSKPYGQPKAD